MSFDQITMSFIISRTSFQDDYWRHLSIRLLWSQIIWSRPDFHYVFKTSYAHSHLRVKLSGAMRGESNCDSPYSDIHPFFNHVFPDFLTWLIYIFSTHLRLSNGKRLSETARNKALCQWLFIRLPWSAHACLWLRSQPLNRKRPSVLSASGMNMLEHSSQALSIMWVFYKSVLLKQYLRGPPFALLKDRVRQTWMW
jgi:hypothetical protein